ncbi:hypothetical protein [Duganella callida]|uniref:Uncharacterized protein n=1 Tax=Duganella callida TaxID=2561932 RepID=A0A4Y9SDG7_9BURK|nr:hypothetical protein [Duganella callida]TFW17786.1 hypothetical protein E4L98_19815 [Duganella callida]
MNIAKPAAFTAVFLFGMLMCEYAWADDGAPATDAEYARLPVCTLAKDGKSLAVEPCRTAPSQVPMPRRPVPQIIQPMPQVKQAPQVGMPPVKPSQPLAAPPAPVPATSCDAGGCFGANGKRYNNVGSGVMAPSGKTCTKAGGLIQC